MEKSILNEVLGLFESAPDVPIVIHRNDKTDEELRRLLEDARFECFIFPNCIEPTIELIEPEQKWIPVTERLPEYERPVMGWDEELQSSRIVNFVYGRFFDDIDMSSVKVTHWMPLPEPPKEDE